MALFLFFTALGGASRIDLLRRTDYSARKEMVVRFISDNHNTAERMSATRDDVDNKVRKHAPFFTACPRFGSCPRLGYHQVLCIWYVVQVRYSIVYRYSTGLYWSGQIL